MSSEVVADEVGVSVDGKVLLSPVSFTLSAARTLAVVGANGSGKTTLLRVLAGVIPASRGSVVVAGGLPDERRAGFRARVAALVGLPPLARDLTLREYLVLIGASWGFDLGAAGRRADGLLHEFGITRLADRFAHELSSGQTQLYVLSVALARPFEILLIDEPEQRLDTERLALVSDALNVRRARGATIVMATHSTFLVQEVADDVLELIEGEPGGLG